MSAVEQIRAFEAQACSSRPEPQGTAQTAVQQTHTVDMSRESTDCSRRVPLPEAAEAVVEQTSPEAAQTDVE